MPSAIPAAPGPLTNERRDGEAGDYALGRRLARRAYGEGLVKGGGRVARASPEAVPRPPRRCLPFSKKYILFVKITIHATVLSSPFSSPGTPNGQAFEEVPSPRAAHGPARTADHRRDAGKSARLIHRKISCIRRARVGEAMVVAHTMMMQGDLQAMDRLLELERHHGFGRAQLAAWAESAPPRLVQPPRALLEASSAAGGGRGKFSSPQSLEKSRNQKILGPGLSGE
jgi:hypothetical protein